MSLDRTAHWQKIYQTKSLDQVSWYQPKPETSLRFITELHMLKTAAIIDVGGGDSFLADNLLALGFTDITVLDISEAAIERAKTRLGDRADRVNWIVADAGSFAPSRQYNLWHDRAAFHFLTAKRDIAHYVETASSSLAKGGHLILGTFSENGPTKCSGIAIKQYSVDEMESLFKEKLVKIKCENLDHRTPFDTTQNFTFCVFKK